MRRLTRRVERLAGREASMAPSACEVCCGWAPQVFVRDGHRPRDEECSACGRRVPIRLIRISALVDLDDSEAEMDLASSSEKLVPITWE